MSPRTNSGVDQHDGSMPEIVGLIPALRAFARIFCRNPADADDLVQETLAKGVAAIDRFEPGTSMKSWLFTIMRNTFYTRVKIHRREIPGLLGHTSDDPVIDAPQEWSLRSKEIHGAIQRLTVEQREVIVLIGVLGTSYEEAANICGCAIGTIKSRLSRARLRLLEDLGEVPSERLVGTGVRAMRPTPEPERRR